MPFREALSAFLFTRQNLVGSMDQILRRRNEKKKLGVFLFNIGALLKDPLLALIRRARSGVGYEAV